MSSKEAKEQSIIINDVIYKVGDKFKHKSGRSEDVTFEILEIKQGKKYKFLRCKSSYQRGANLDIEKITISINKTYTDELHKSFCKIYKV